MKKNVRKDVSIRRSGQIRRIGIINESIKPCTPRQSPPPLQHAGGGEGWQPPTAGCTRFCRFVNKFLFFHRAKICHNLACFDSKIILLQARSQVHNRKVRTHPAPKVIWERNTKKVETFHHQGDSYIVQYSVEEGGNADVLYYWQVATSFSDSGRSASFWLLNRISGNYLKSKDHQVMEKMIFFQI